MKQTTKILNVLFDGGHMRCFILIIGFLMAMTAGLSALADDDSDSQPTEHVPPITDIEPEIKEMAAKMQPQWMTCGSSEDCGLVIYDCAHLALAVNRTYIKDAQEIVCQTELCAWLKCGSVAYNFSPACEQGQCVTHLEPFDLN